MKITKLGHACLLVETPDRTALFDPGTLSKVDVDAIERLDDIFITHHHGDHMDVDLIKRLHEKFPSVRVTAPEDAQQQLKDANISNLSTTLPDGARSFESPHEIIRPYFDSDPPQEIGVHYLDVLSHPGDSHSFTETMPVLALPVMAPWGSSVAAVKLALDLKPRYIIPIHDWFWHDQARASAYDNLERVFAEHNITFIKPENGVAFDINL